MATSTYDPIVTYTLPSTSATISIGSIPGTYRDLVLVINGKMTPNTAYVDINVNGDSNASNYYLQIGQGNGSTSVEYADALSSYNGFFMYNDASQVVCHFFDYAQTNKKKSWLWRADNTLITQMGVMSWNNSSSPITSIYLTDNSGESFAAGTTISLYGVHG